MIEESKIPAFHFSAGEAQGFSISKPISYNNEVRDGEKRFPFCERLAVYNTKITAMDIFAFALAIVCHGLGIIYYAMMILKNRH